MGGAVDLGHVEGISSCLGKLIPGGGQALAVATPGRIAGGWVGR